MADSSASAVFRQLRAAPADPAAHAAQLALVRRLVHGGSEIHWQLPRKARARALLEWAAGRCAAREKDGSNAPSSILDPEYWNLFSQILSLKDDSATSTSHSSLPTSEQPDLLSKSDIRQIVLLSKGISLLNALKTCLDSIPSLLSGEVTSQGTSSSTTSVAASNTTKALLQHVHSVFERLFPLSLSSPTTTLDGLLPCIHAFIRSSGSLASSSFSDSTSSILPEWNKLGHLLLDTLSELVKTSSNVQSASANDKLLLRKVSSSFLDQAGGYANWKAYIASYTSVLQALTPSTSKENGRASKGKGKAREVGVPPTETSLDAVIASLASTSSAPSGSSTFTGQADSASDELSSLLTLLNSFISTSVFSPANLARYFSTSSGSTLETPKQAQEGLSEIFSALRASLNASSSPSSSLTSEQVDSSISPILVLPRLVADYIDTLSSHSHDLFAPARRNRPTGDVGTAGVAGGPAPSAGQSSRSAVEYQVQLCFRTAVFGMLQGCVQLLRGYATSASSNPSAAKSPIDKASPRKRQRAEMSASSTSSDTLRWAAAESLKLILAQIQERNIYITGGGDVNRQWLQILKDSARLAVEELLADSSKEDINDKDANAVVAVVQTTTYIAKMDYTALEEVLPSLLRVMGRTVPPFKQVSFSFACDELLDTALSYNGKIRQLNTFINNVEEAIVSIIEESASSSVDAHAFVSSMDILFQSPLLSRHNSVRLSKECKSSLGPAQFSTLMKHLLEQVQSQLVELKQGEGNTQHSSSQPPKKKSRSGRSSTVGSATAPPPSTIKQEEAAWKIYAIVHLATSTLSGNTATSVFGSTTGDVEELDSVLAGLFGQAVVQDQLATADSATQRVVQAMLQLRTSWNAFSETEGSSDDAVISSLSNVLMSSVHSLPALRFEIIQTLLSKATMQTSHKSNPLIDSIIAILSSASPEKSLTWTGYLHNLSEEDLPVATWWLVSTRFLDVVDEIATDEQLNSFVQFVFTHSANLAAGHEKAVTIPSITDRLLHSSDFFELLRIRSSVSNFVNQLCESASLTDAHLDILLLLPREYVDRSLKRKIVSALAGRPQALADQKILLTMLKFTKDDAGQPLIKDTTFLQQLAEQTNAEVSTLVHRLYEQLWRLMLQNWTASPDSFTALPAFLDTIATSASGTIVNQHFKTWRILAAETKLTSVPAEVIAQLKARAASLKQSTSGDFTGTSQLYNQLEACNTAQIVSEWMGIDEAGVGDAHTDNAEIARKAIASLLQLELDSSNDILATVYMALELGSRNLNTAQLDFEAFVVTFWLLAQKFDLTAVRFTTLLAKTCSSQPEEVYKAAISTISEAVSPHLSDDAFAAALPILAVLICNSPESATRVASQAFSASLRRISLLNQGRSLAHLSATVLRAVTGYIKAFLEQRIGVPELQDVTVIWTVLHDILTPAPDAQMPMSNCSNATATSIFLDSVDIVSLLATHRRDHVIPTFAPFSRVLSDILQLLRLSGVSASASITACNAEFPGWAQAGRGQWIREDKCSKAVARLLLGLGTRTTVLQRSSSRARGSTSSAVVSLSGPLSKHAPFILVNYLTAATDSRFSLSPAVRKEINAGILEVLSTMGKSEREALMKAYLQKEQEAERVLLRVMWKDFEAVRYRGD